MGTAGRLGAALGVAACVSLAVGRVLAQVPQPDVSPEEMLRAHNEWREKVGVRPLRWASDLADLARTRAERLAGEGCTLRHDALEDVGENLLLATPLHGSDGTARVASLRPAQVVDAWAAESESYSYDTNRCAAGRDCLHYTQIVWAATEEVGCGAAVCPSKGQVWVCDYRPAGNTRGKRPY